MNDTSPASGTLPSTMPVGLTRSAWFILALALGLLYVLTAATTVLGGDDGEFLTLMVEGGRAHPPGYQLTVLVLRALSWLPGVSPAHTAALATSLVGVAAALMVGRASRAWGASESGALVAAAVYGVSSMAWIEATHAEVFALNVLLAASICWLVGPRAPLEGSWQAVALAALAGVGLTNHHSLVLLAPVGLVGVALALRDARRPVLTALAALAIFVTAIAVPTLLSELLPHPADAWSWGALDSLASWWHHFSRADFGTLQLGLTEMESSPMGHVVALLRHHALGLLIAPFAVALWAMVIRLRSATERARNLALVLTYFTTGPLFVATFNLSTEGVSGHIVERFYLLPAAILCLFVGLGWTELMRLAPLRTSLQALVLIGLIGAGIATGLPAVTAHHDPAVERYLIDLLDSAPPNSVLLGSGDQRLFGLLYVQRVLEQRPDVTYVDVRMLHYPWYLSRIESKLGRELTGPEAQSLNTLTLAREVLATGRPLMLATALSPRILESLPSYPRGAAIQILAPGQQPPSPAELERFNLELFSRFELTAAPPDRDTWAGLTRSNYAASWMTLAGAFEQGGDREAARRCWARAVTLAPWVVPPTSPPQLGR